MVKCIIADDEQHVVSKITALLQTYFKNKIKICTTVKRIDDLIKEVTLKNVDLIFLDIQFGHQNIFEYLGQIYKAQQVDIIFITAYEKYAVKAINSYFPEGYILKPIADSEFINVVNSYLNRKKSETNNFRMEQLFKVLTTDIQTRTIAVSTANDVKLLNYFDIKYIKADRNYCKLYTLDNSEILSSKPLKYYETQLPELYFFRIHKEILINTLLIETFKVNENTITLSTGEEFEVAVRRKKDLVKRLFDK